MPSELLAALGLVLVLEGIMPFISPRSFRKTMFRVIQLQDRALRMVGLVSMGLGLLVLYFLR